MEKFKIGDRIVLTEDAGGSAVKGVEGSILRVASQNVCDVRLDGLASTYWVFHDQMELVDAPQAKHASKLVDAPPDITRELAYLKGFADGWDVKFVGINGQLSRILENFEHALNAHSIDMRYKFEILQAYGFGLSDWRVNQEIQSINQKLF